MIETLHILLLLLTANGTPVVMKMTFRDHLDYPLDGNRTFIDGQPIFGYTKTFRGVLSSILTTTLIAPAIGLPAIIGVIAGCYAMLGDLLSSFIKRRCGIPSSKMALGLDQIPESLLPLVAVRSYFDVTWGEMLLVMGEFFILEVVLSHLFIRFYVKNHTQLNLAPHIPETCLLGSPV